MHTMMSRIFVVFIVVAILSLANGQNRYPYNMNPFFQNMGGGMRDIFEDIQNSFKQLVPWYNGDNVCVDESYRPDPLSEQMYPEEFANSNSETETCRGNSVKYMCVASISENGVALQRVRKYECCPGFVRASEGPGCVPYST